VAWASIQPYVLRSTGLPPNRCVDCSTILPKRSPAQSKILALYFPGPSSGPEGTSGPVRFLATTKSPVVSLSKPVDYSRTHLPPLLRRFPGSIRVWQLTRVPSRWPAPGCTTIPLGLFMTKYTIIFVYDVQWNIPGGLLHSSVLGGGILTSITSLVFTFTEGLSLPPRAI